MTAGEAYMGLRSGAFPGLPRSVAGMKRHLRPRTTSPTWQVDGLWTSWLNRPKDWPLYRAPGTRPAGNFAGELSVINRARLR